VLKAGRHSKPPVIIDGKPREAAFVIPGNFSSAVLTGDIRIMFEDELPRAAQALEKGGYVYNFVPGWMLAITDCDQVG
jgi:hypothetical protein